MVRIISALALWCATHASGSELARERVRSLIEQSGADVSVAFRTLDGRHELLIGPDEVYHAASISSVLNQASQP